ncbi:hypothetical protein KAFR_0A08330 [Kazachstania africana CBS 2517]|uniref:pH-response regulator protein palH/RIM21 n=1 Tax=Kazachstania africana (strain ATCC 22294 / BCRC 22015 / CBS 2517 / CECT 1963 / NBRC 1671 / NRRL Y-8276) TaxID=1071382 RepID=H2APG7_KAZAF|nr:hypothetical protein KAFR_0A08330 [Kazachstania africana CBS 2517]CCF56267.1 hypothetical protein KAFR_0A08330 [Kazachstania africana CBS 2517]
MEQNGWKIQDQYSSGEYLSCQSNNIGSGILIGRSIPGSITYADHVHFQSNCYAYHPLYMTGSIRGFTSGYIDLVANDWDKFIHDNKAYGGGYQYGIYPLIMLLTANFVIIISLTVLVFINTRDKPHVHVSRLMKCGSLATSINISYSLTRILSIVRDQYVRYGICNPNDIISFFSKDAAFVTLAFLSTVLFQLCQVFIVARTFERNQEKRVIFFVGTFLALLANIFWLIPHYYSVTHTNSTLELLPPFAYLFRICIASSYACFIIGQVLNKHKLSFSSFQLSFLTILALLVVLLLPGFFIADVANAWISELDEVFAATCYISSSFVVWEWLDRLTILERKEQAQSILGRPIYEDEQQGYTFAKYALRVQNALVRAETATDIESGSNSTDNDSEYLMANYNSNDSSIDIDLIKLKSKDSMWRGNAIENQHDEGRHYPDLVHSSDDLTSIDKVEFNTQKTYKDMANERINNFVTRVLDFTDRIIVNKIASQSLSFSSRSSKNSKKKKKNIMKKRLGLDKSNDVFVYSTKEVVFESDDEEEEGNLE